MEILFLLALMTILSALVVALAFLVLDLYKRLKVLAGLVCLQLERDIGNDEEKRQSHETATTSLRR